MNLDTAHAEPICVYYKAHEALNNLVKITTAGLDYIRQITDLPDGLDQLNAIVRKTTEPWGPIGHSNVNKLRTEAIAYLAGLAVVHCYSAFDLFLTDTKAECDRWDSVRATTYMTGTCRDGEGNISLPKLYEMYNWNIASIQRFVPLFRYFQECRNCIAHRDGLASGGLCKIAEGTDLQECIANWPFSKANTHLPSLPAFNAGDPIVLAPKHSILASANCYRIAEDIDRNLIRYLDTKGMVSMATHYALFAEQHQSRLRNHRTPEAAVMYFLVNRYSVKGADQQKVKALLVSMDLWNGVLTKYSELYG
jgi:hypothetical protein